jgi:hypothetical protein
MAITNPNIVGSGYIAFPPQRRFEKPLFVQPPTISHLEFPEEWKNAAPVVGGPAAQRPASAAVPQRPAQQPASGNVGLARPEVAPVVPPAMAASAPAAASAPQARPVSGHYDLSTGSYTTGSPARPPPVQQKQPYPAGVAARQQHVHVQPQQYVRPRVQGTNGHAPGAAAPSPAGGHRPPSSPLTAAYSGPPGEPRPASGRHTPQPAAAAAAAAPVRPHSAVAPSPLPAAARGPAAVAPSAVRPTAANGRAPAPVPVPATSNTAATAAAAAAASLTKAYAAQAKIQDEESEESGAAGGGGGMSKSQKKRLRKKLREDGKAV